MIELFGRLNDPHQGLMLGNGELGALFFGSRFLTISLDKINLWDKREPDEFKSKNFNFSYLSKTLKDNYEEAYKLFDNCYLHSFPTKISAGAIITNIAVDDSDQSTINCETGVVTYKSANSNLKSYIDANKNVIVLEFSNDVSYSFEMPAYFYKDINNGGLGYEQPTYKKDGNFEIIKQKTYDKNAFYIVIYRKDNNLFISICENKIKQTQELLLNYVSNKEDNFLSHLSSYKSYFGESNVITPNQRFNDLYTLGKYYFYANSSKKYPMNLNGVWTNCDGNLPKWKGDYHNDLNLQMTYEAYLKCGNYKEGKVLLNYLVGLSKQFALNAKKFLKTKGLYIPGVMTIDGKPLGGWPQYSLNPSTEIWLIKAFDEYYEYTKDNEYLKKVIFPFFKKIEVGFRSLLNINSDGYYEISFHSSPEYFEDDKKSLFDDQTNFEIINIYYLYSTLCKFCNILNIDDSQYRKMLAKVAPLYKNKNGETMISKTKDFDMSHRHFSHILHYKNFKIENPFDLENISNIKKDIAVIEKYGFEKWTGFSFVEMAGLKTLINDGESAFKYLEIFSKYLTNKNGFHMNIDKDNNYSKLDCYVMTLEANVGFVSALNDMLIKSFNNKLCIFPAVPEEFNKNTSFNNLRIYGNHKVSGSLQNGKKTFVIELNKNDLILLENNFSKNPTFYVDGKEMSFKAELNDIIEIKANKRIELR